MTRFINPELVAIARDQVKKAAAAEKAAFVGDPASGGMPPGGDPAAMGGDPAAGGGMPPPGMDPAAAGGMPPPASGSPTGDVGGGLTEQRVMEMIQQASGGAGAGMGPGGKKKVDVNTEIYQIKRILVKLLSTLGVQVEPDMLLGDPAEDPRTPPGEAASDPASSAAQPGALESAIKPIDAMQGASPQLAQGGGEKQAQLRSPGTAFSPDALPRMRDKASALRTLIQRNAS